MTRYLLLGLVVVVLLGWGFASFRGGVAVQTAAVRRGPIQEFVDERGKTGLPLTHEITMPFAGRVEAIALREGESVKQGQVVARLVQADLDDEVAQAKAAVDRLGARIVENDDTSVEKSSLEQAELQVESMKATVAAAEQRKIAGKSQLDYAETFLGRVRSLLQSGASTREQLEQAELSYVKSQSEYRQDVLTAESQKSLQAATNLTPRMIGETIARKSLTHNVLAQEKAEAEARLRTALQRQQRGVMVSPVDGVVLSRAITNEQFQAAGVVLARIGQLERLELEAEILSEDVVRIRPGDRVEIYGPAIGGDVGNGVAGTVDRIYPAGFTKMSSLGVEQQRVLVIVRFAEGVLAKLVSEQQLGVDFRVRVRIVTDEKADATLVPRAALFRAADGQWQVFAVRGGRAVLQTIELGLMNDESVEVVKGLSATDVVVVAPDSGLANGIRVVAAK